MLKNLIFGAVAMLISNYAYAQLVPIVVKDIKANGDADVSEIAACNGKLFFTANDGTGSSAWVTDGTAGNTVSLQTNGGRDYSEYNGKTYFIAKDNNNYEQLWVTDGTPLGTSQLAEINDKGHGIDDIYTVANNKLFFSGIDSLHGTELWATDGTAVGTQLIADIYPDTISGLRLSFPNCGVYNNRIFFTGYDNNGDGLELWVSDGTAGGTYMYKDINPGASSSMPANFSSINGKLYFTATASHTGRELWVLDDQTGIASYINIVSGNTSSNPSAVIEFNNKMYFMGGSLAPAVQHLYKTDGTSANTIKLIDSVSNMITFSGHIYYGKSKGIMPGQGQGLHYALYKTVGDVGSPQLFVSDLVGGNSYTPPRDFTICNGKLYFLQMHDGLDGIEDFTVNDLWMHDPITNQTDLIMSTANSGDAAFIFTNTGITAYNNNIYFKGKEQQGEELYKLGEAPVGIADVEKINRILLYPNPSKNSLYVRAISNEPIQQISIVDTKGQLVYLSNTNNSLVEINTAQIEAGLYYIEVQHNNGSRTSSKFIKQ